MKHRRQYLARPYNTLILTLVILFLGSTRQARAVNIAGQWTMEYNFLHSFEHVVDCDYYGGVPECEEYDLIDDFLDEGILHADVQQNGSRIWGIFTNEDGDEYELEGTVSGLAVEFIIIIPAWDDYLPGLYRWTGTRMDLHFAGTCDEGTGVITGQITETQDRKYWEDWFYGYRSTSESTNLLATGEMTITVQGGDLNEDSTVNLSDFARLAQYWQTDASVADIYPVLEGDGIVDLNDLAFMCEHWLEGTE